MNRKEFIATTARVAAGLTLGCPCAAAVRAAAHSQAAAPVAPKTAPEYPHATPYEARAEFAKTWTGRFFRILDQHLDVPARQALMRANGRACAMDAYGPPDPAKQVSIDELVSRLAAYVGQENARREGDTVYFSYRQNPAGLRTADGYCLCPIVEDGPADLSPTFCQCSAGYVAYLFERNTGQTVSVDVLESVRSGGTACRFAVHV